MSVYASMIGGERAFDGIAALMAEMETSYGPPPPDDIVQWGSCRNYPTDVFFPTRGGNTSKGKSICKNDCAVYLECREYALTLPASAHGIWGGLSREERLQILWPTRGQARAERKLNEQARKAAAQARRDDQERQRAERAAARQAERQQVEAARLERKRYRERKRQQAAEQLAELERQRSQAYVPLGRIPRNRVKLRTRSVKWGTKFTVEVRTACETRFEVSSVLGWDEAVDKARVRLVDRPDLLQELDEALLAVQASLDNHQQTA